MARQLGLNTVVAWFGRLPYEQQKSALDKIQQQHDQARSARRAELEGQLAALGYTAGKRRGRPRKSVVASGNGSASAKRRTGKVKAKYRDPKTRETWSGRGRMASWLKTKQDAGENIEKYLI